MIASVERRTIGAEGKDMERKVLERSKGGSGGFGYCNLGSVGVRPLRGGESAARTSTFDDKPHGQFQPRFRVMDDIPILLDRLALFRFRRELLTLYSKQLAEPPPTRRLSRKWCLSELRVEFLRQFWQGFASSQPLVRHSRDIPRDGSLLTSDRPQPKVSGALGCDPVRFIDRLAAVCRSRR